MNRARQNRVAFLVAFAAIVAGSSACSVQGGDPRGDARGLARAVSAGDVASVPFVEMTADEVARRVEPVFAHMGGRIPAVAVGDVFEDGNGVATAELAYRWELGSGENADWEYTTTAAMELVDDRWRPVWDPSLLAPGLRPGERLRLQRESPRRASIIGAGGAVLDPADDVAPGLLGTVGPADAQTAEASAGTIDPGDRTGLTGLQKTHNAQLAGTEEIRVEALGENAKPGSGRELFHRDSVPGKPVQVTLDRRLQTAADARLATVDTSAAAVVMRASTGDVLVAASAPADSSTATTAMIPPGTAFVPASALALLRAGVTLDAPAPCPPTAEVGSITIANPTPVSLPSATLRADLANGCATTLAELAEDVDTAVVTNAARSLGFGQSVALGVPAFLGDGAQIPGEDLADRATLMAGQGGVAASPLTLATMQASITAGRTLTPRLVVQPAPKQPSIPAADAAAPPLTTRQVLGLRSIQETATQSGPAAFIAGSADYAATGVSDTPGSEHQAHWVVATVGDVALAVLVADSPTAAATARSVTADLLGELG